VNLRALSEADLADTLEDVDFGGASAYTLIDLKGTEYPVKGMMGDIGYLLDGEGNPVQGRSIVGAFRISSLAALTSSIPGKGWKAIYTDMQGKTWTLYLVRYEPDRTLGVGRAVYSLDLAK
jgi:hypothetical protein